MMRGSGVWCALALLLALSSTTSAQTGDTTNSLYAVDLASGQMNRVGTIGDGTPVVGLAVSADGPTSLYALTVDGRLWRFTPFAPSVIQTEVDITGLAPGEDLVAIDVRPATGKLYAISDASTIYIVDTRSGQATPVGASFAPIIDGTLLGFDFNPAVDRIRLVDDAGQNLRLNPDAGQIGSNAETGAPTIDGFTAYAADDANAGLRPTLSGAGYTNSVATAESTQLYVIDAAQGVLAIQDPPNDGVLRTVGPLGMALEGPVGFDIATSGLAFAAR
jgi:hypothetical protein